jgi:hypothetical protein
MIRQLKAWHNTRVGLLVFAIAELLLAYGAASWAIDSGNLLLYLATIVLLIGGLQNLIKLGMTFFHGKRQTT